jgi:hypothetical protein
MDFVTHNAKRRLGALSALLCGAAVAVGSGASFTSATANPSNTFTTGTMSHSNSNDNAAILTATGLKPGDSTSGTVDIGNTGSGAGTFTLSKSNLTNSDAVNPLSAKLDVLVEDCGLFSGATPPSCTGATSKYSGKIGAMGTIALGSFATSAKHRYRFTVSFPDSGVPGAENAYQGDDMSIQYDWNGTS